MENFVAVLVDSRSGVLAACVPVKGTIDAFVERYPDLKMYIIWSGCVGSQEMAQKETLEVSSVLRIEILGGIL